MERFISSPNLPENMVSHVIMSDYIIDAVNEIKTNFIISVTVPDSISDITGSEKYHADMGTCHLGGNRFIIDSSNQSVKEKLIELDAKYELCSGISEKEPLLNVCILGKKILCNIRKTEKRIIDFARENNMKIIHTNQGYTKCSVAVVSENAVITSDKGIAALCNKENIDVLLIKEGFIDLEGYPYGFIGGCCGKISPEILAFSGKIESHPDFENINSFALNYNINIISLSNKPLYDIGGIHPICEYKKIVR